MRLSHKPVNRKIKACHYQSIGCLLMDALVKEAAQQYEDLQVKTAFLHG